MARTYSVTRLTDGAVLAYSSKTALIPAVSLFSTQRAPEFFTSDDGEAILLASPSTEKVFNLSFLSGDYSGVDHRILADFFKAGVWYSLTDSELTVQNFDFTPVSVEVSTTSVELTVRARFNVNAAEYIDTLYTRVIVPGQEAPIIPAFTYTNTHSVPMSIRVVYEADSVVNWLATETTRLAQFVYDFDIGVAPTKPFMFFKPGKISRPGVYIPWSGKRVVRDSWREGVEGESIMSAANAYFLRVEPGQSVRLATLATIPFPITTAERGYTLRIEAFGRSVS